MVEVLMFLAFGFLGFYFGRRYQSQITLESPVMRQEAEAKALIYLFGFRDGRKNYTSSLKAAITLAPVKDEYFQEIGLKREDLDL